MAIPNPQVEQMIRNYMPMVKRIIAQRYFKNTQDVKDELFQCGLIGIWDAVVICRKRQESGITNEYFYGIARRHVLWRMAEYFRKQANDIKLCSRDWDLRGKVKGLIYKLLADDPNATQSEIARCVKQAGLNYDKYETINNVLESRSLDKPVGEDAEANGFDFLSHIETGFDVCNDRDYIKYIIQAAMAGLKKERDKRMVCDWLSAVYRGDKVSRADIAAAYGVSVSTADIAVRRFIGLCCAVRDKEELACAKNG